MSHRADMEPVTERDRPWFEHVPRHRRSPRDMCRVCCPLGIAEVLHLQTNGRITLAANHRTVRHNEGVTS